MCKLTLHVCPFVIKCLVGNCCVILNKKRFIGGRKILFVQRRRRRSSHFVAVVDRRFGQLNVLKFLCTFVTTLSTIVWSSSAIVAGIRWTVFVFAACVDTEECDHGEYKGGYGTYCNVFAAYSIFCMHRHLLYTFFLVRAMLRRAVYYSIVFKVFWNTATRSADDFLRVGFVAI